jgi:hypothetical protein
MNQHRKYSAEEVEGNLAVDIRSIESHGRLRISKGPENAQRIEALRSSGVTLTEEGSFYLCTFGAPKRNLVVNNLRVANEERAKIWGASGQIDMDWRMNELAGEAGEACNVLKKIVREMAGEVGSRASKDRAIEELSDVVICLDLMAMAADLPQFGLGEANDPLPEPFGLNAHGIWLSMSVNMIVAAHFMQHIAPYYHAQIGQQVEVMPAQHYQSFQLDHIVNSVAVVNAIARKLGVFDMRQAISKKFNATSHKNGLPVFLNLEDVLTMSEVIPA